MEPELNPRERACILLHEIYSIIDYVGQRSNNKTLEELGIVNYTFLELINRVARNADALHVLINKNNFLEENRQPLMVLLRAMISDLFIGVYLFQFKSDPTSFQNEVNVLDRDFASFAEFMIKEEPSYGFIAKEYGKLKSAEEIEKFSSEKKQEFIEAHINLYVEENGSHRLRTNSELRSSSNDIFFEFAKSDSSIIIDKKHSIKEKYVFDRLKSLTTVEESHLKAITYAYLQYRGLSQYCHFSMLPVHILNKEPEDETSWIANGIGQSCVLLNFILIALEIDEERHKQFVATFSKYFGTA